MAPRFFPHAAQVLEILRVHGQVQLLVGCSSPSVILGSEELEENGGVGLNAGGRLGSARTEFNEFNHRQDVIGGMFCTLSMDMEIPCGCCTFWTGMRTEWGYTWSDVLQRRNDSDMQDVNILFTAGVRF